MLQVNEDESNQFISFFDAKPAVLKKQTELPVISTKVDARRVNMFGDTYRKNQDGQVVFFKYADADVSYTFTYDESGVVNDVGGSNGWCWTKGEDGWAVSNCFDRWTVPSGECNVVTCTDRGIKAEGSNPSVMGLPERR